MNSDYGSRTAILVSLCSNLLRFCQPKNSASHLLFFLTIVVHKQLSDKYSD